MNPPWVNYFGYAIAVACALVIAGIVAHLCDGDGGGQA